jgi:hypothetical protein
MFNQTLLQDIQESCEPTMFSIEQLLFAIANDQRSSDETILKVLPMLHEVYVVEKKNRQAVRVNEKNLNISVIVLIFIQIFRNLEL